MGRRILLISILFVVAFSFAFGAGIAWAKYPDKKIRFIVPYPPGGPADQTARALAPYVNPYLDGRVYVENIPGAGGAIGSSKAWLFSRCLKRADLILVTKNIEENILGRMFARRADTVEGAIEMALHKNGAEAKIIVMENASDLIPFFYES
jgi:hypothetical protein